MIRAHLKLEDEKLYPVLAQSSDPKIREKAARFQKEMGALAPAYVAFAEKWMRSGGDLRKPVRFRLRMERSSRRSPIAWTVRTTISMRSLSACRQPN